MLIGCGAEELLPLFAKKRVTYKELGFLTDADLAALGVTSQFLRRRVLGAVQEVQQGEDGARRGLEGGGGVMGGEASAPPEDDVSSAPSAPEDTAPSAPVETFQSAECVVCLERQVRGEERREWGTLYLQCDIIFLPCGHLCSCSSCQVPPQPPYPLKLITP